MRLDRLASLYLARPLRGTPAKPSARLPVLMYHSVSREDESAVRAYYRVATPPELFARQMQCLHDGGWQAVTLSQGLEHLRQPANGARQVALTFDDGYADFLAEAAPTLLRLGFSATVFLPTAYVDDAPRQFKGRACLTWSQVRELHHVGIEFGSHTHSHRQMKEVPLAEWDEELSGSRQRIADQLGAAVDTFAYPYAFPGADASFKARLRDHLAKAGYRAGACTTVGTAAAGHDPYFLPRLPVNSADDLALLRAKLEGAYDWMGVAQTLSKQWRVRVAGR